MEVFLRFYIDLPVSELSTMENVHSSFDINPDVVNISRNKSRLTHTSTWINLGLWIDKEMNGRILNYATACENLACKLAKSMNLQSDDCILDLAIGKGDQSLLWCKAYNVKKVIGIDISQSHVRSAKQLVKEANLNDKIILLNASADDLTFLLNKSTIEWNINKVVSLDAAYHFNTRSDCFNQLKNYFNNNTNVRNYTVGMIDIVLHQKSDLYEKPLRLYHRFLIWLFCFMTTIPQQNIYSWQRYKEILRKEGFTDIKVEFFNENDIFLGFYDFINDRCNTKYCSLDNMDFLKYRITAAVIKYLAKNNIIQAILFTAEYKRTI